MPDRAIFGAVAGAAFVLVLGFAFHVGGAMERVAIADNGQFRSQAAWYDCAPRGAE